MPSRELTWLLRFLILLLTATPSFATHLRGGEIRVERQDCSSFAVKITLIIYVNTQSYVAVGGEGDFLDFGDGTTEPVPETLPVIVDTYLHVGRAQYETTHIYAQPGPYVISYTEANRNFGILNFDGSGNTKFYTETKISLRPGICNNSPMLLVPPIDRACSGTKFYHDVGAVDPDGDSLSYELTIPKKGPDADVDGYRFPNDPKFYSTSFDEANEAKNGPPTFAFGGPAGTITWDAPGLVGEYAVAIKITEWKFNALDSTWREGGYVIRDMQIIVEECNNRRPQLMPPSDPCVIAGTTIQFDLAASDPDSDNVAIEAFSEVFTLAESKAVLEPESGVVQATRSPNDTASVQFT